MRLGVFCSDDRATALLEGARPHAEFIVVAVTDQDPWAELALPKLSRRPTWEDLLADNRLDAVLVGGTEPRLLDAARQFAQSGTPLWVLPHPQHGLLFAYELNLAAQETQAPLQAVFPHRAAAVWHGDLPTESAPDYVEFVRRIPPLTPSEKLLSLAAVDQHLLMDLDLLSWQLGSRSRVTTLRSGETEAGIRRQTVTLGGEGVPEIVWSIEPSVDSAVSAECRFHSGGKTLVYREADGEWFCDDLKPAMVSAPPNFAAVVSWSAAITAFELLDAVEHSLERHRTIEVHREAVSERAIFKTRMAAWGCGILILTLLLMVSFLIVASVVPLNGTLLALGRIVVFAPLFIFLFAQLLLPLTRSAKKN